MPILKSFGISFVTANRKEFIAVFSPIAEAEPISKVKDTESNSASKIR